jgi:hypothetical protein
VLAAVVALGSHGLSRQFGGNGGDGIWAEYICGQSLRRDNIIVR